MVLMRVRSSHQDFNGFCATPAIQHWLGGAKTKFKLGLFCHAMYAK